MKETESIIRPSDFIDFLEGYLLAVRGGGDLQGAVEAGRILYGLVRVFPQADFSELLRHARMRVDAHTRTYRAPDPKTETREQQGLRDIGNRSYHYERG